MAHKSAGTIRQSEPTSLSSWYFPGMPPGLDELHLTSLRLVPEVSLHLAQDAIIFWARLEAEAKTGTPPPFWATAWAGGQALARHLLDNPSITEGKRVLDIGSGSGLVAIAAAKAGAAKVVANDIDPGAIAAISVNAEANEVEVQPWFGDILRGDITDFDVVIIGDVLYEPGIAEDMLRILRAQAATGAVVLVGDPGRGHLPSFELRLLATYPMVDAAFTDAELKNASVYQLMPN